jgi:hypothetical protein
MIGHLEARIEELTEEKKKQQHEAAQLQRRAHVSFLVCHLAED